MDDPDVKQLRDVFLQTISPNPAVIKQAEGFLKAAALQPRYAVAVLKLVSADAPIEIRQAAAVNFKNHIKFHWDPQDGQPGIVDSEKDQIKTLITSLMLSTPPIVRAQLSEALALISTHDFPARWPTLLPELQARLATDDAQVTLGVLQTANAIFKRYRNQFMTDALSRDLEQSQAFVQPLLTTLQRLTTKVQAHHADKAALTVLLFSVRLVFRIFFSLNSPGLTEEFEKTLKEWMAELHTYLTYADTAAQDSDTSKESPLDAVKSAICQNLNLFMGMNEEEFAPYLSTFVSDVWTLLVGVSLEASQDNLVINAVKFLTTVAKSVHYGFFKDPTTLQQVCEKIVVPNLRMREDLVEMFEMNYVEYIRRDTEGGDADTRRRAAYDLVKALTERFPAEVTQLFSGYVSAMLAQYAQNPQEHWQAKDCAIYLVLALTVRGKTSAAGATQTNQLVSINDFCAQHIVPELESPNLDERPVIKADAIKFVITLRSQLPRETGVSLLAALVALLGAEANVVHSYAALALERLLALRDAGQPRFTPADLRPHLQQLLQRLFGAFEKPDSGENEYLMRAVMRVITFVGAEIAPVAAICLQRLADMLLAVCANPQQPGFNHYLFESVAALLRYACAGQHAMLAACEELLFPAFQIVLQQDVQEFHPYVFQIFSQLIGLRSKPLPATYLQIFPPLLTPLFWERSGNIPALVGLMQAYLSKAADEVMAGGHLPSLLGVFQKLLASKVHDHEGLLILTAVLQFLPLDTVAPYMPQVWSLLFTRLQTARTAKFERALVVFLAHFACQHGVTAVQESIDQVQAGLFTMVVQSVWLPKLANILAGPEARVVAVATTRVLTQAAPLQGPTAGPVWGSLLGQLVSGLAGQQSGNGVATAHEDNADEDVEEYAGYSAAFARLHNAYRPEPNPLPDIPKPEQYLATTLAQFAAAHPGQVRPLVQANLTPTQQQQLEGYLSAAGAAIV